MPSFDDSKKAFLSKQNNGFLTEKEREALDLGERVDKYEDDIDMHCGFGPCDPEFLQPFKAIGCFTACYSATGIVTSALSLYISSQITTLEKHFNFSSSVSGFLLSCNDLGYLLTTLVISFYARRIHIPRALACSTIIYGISGLLCTIAYFGTRDQLSSPPAGDDSDETAGQMCVTSGVSNLTLTCQEEAELSATANVSHGWRAVAIAVIAIGMIVQGVAKSPRQSFIGVFVDDNVPKVKTTMYLGIIVGLSIFGPALAFTIGGLFSKIYVTLEETSMTTKDPRWIGAWWLGFLVFGSLGLVVGFPLVCFPKRLTRKRELEDIKEQKKSQVIVGNKAVHEVKEFLTSMLRLVGNPVYICIVLSTGVTLMSVSGTMAFRPKYIETQFTIPAWKANIMLGVMGVVAACLGTIVGGFLTTKLKLSPPVCLKVMITCSAVSAILLSFGFIFGCDQPAIYKGKSLSNFIKRNNVLDTDCSKMCGCKDADFTFFPVCGSDNRNYFSPCHAGCTQMNGTTRFSNCRCVEDHNNTNVRNINTTIDKSGLEVFGNLDQTNTETNWDTQHDLTGTAEAGLCDPDCSSLYPYLGIMFFSAFIMTLSIMPGFVVSVRSVTEADKPLAIGLSAFMGTLIGWFPGPIIFGALIDSTCLLTKSTCETDGACLLYDLDLFRNKYHGLAIGLHCLALLLQTLAFIFTFCLKRQVFFAHTDDLSAKTESSATQKNSHNRNIGHSNTSTV